MITFYQLSKPGCISVNREIVARIDLGELQVSFSMEKNKKCLNSAIFDA